MKVLSIDEIVRINEIQPGDISERNWLIMRVFLLTGIRVAELVGLNFEDVYYQTEPKRLLLVRSDIAKGGKGREIPINEKLRTDLRGYYSRRVVDVGTLGHDPGMPLFTQHRSTSKRLTTRQVQRIVCMVGNLARIPKLHPHTLRHTFATSLLKQTNIRTIQAILGHTSLQSTQIYTHPNTDDMTLAVNKL